MLIIGVPVCTTSIHLVTPFIYEFGLVLFEYNAGLAITHKGVICKESQSKVFLDKFPFPSSLVLNFGDRPTSLSGRRHFEYPIRDDFQIK